MSTHSNLDIDKFRMIITLIITNLVKDVENESGVRSMTLDNQVVMDYLLSAETRGEVEKKIMTDCLTALTE